MSSVSRLPVLGSPFRGLAFRCPAPRRAGCRGAWASCSRFTSIGFVLVFSDNDDCLPVRSPGRRGHSRAQQRAARRQQPHALKPPPCPSRPRAPQLRVRPGRVIEISSPTAPQIAHTPHDTSRQPAGDPAPAAHTRGSREALWPLRTFGTARPCLSQSSRSPVSLCLGSMLCVSRTLRVVCAIAVTGDVLVLGSKFFSNPRLAIHVLKYMAPRVRTAPAAAWPRGVAIKKKDHAHKYTSHTPIIALPDTIEASAKHHPLQMGGGDSVE